MQERDPRFATYCRAGNSTNRVLWHPRNIQWFSATHHAGPRLAGRRRSESAAGTRLALPAAQSPPGSGRLNTVHQESDVYETLSGAGAEAAPPPLFAGPPARLTAFFARIGVSAAMVKGAAWSMGGYATGAVA